MTINEISNQFCKPNSNNNINLNHNTNLNLSIFNVNGTHGVIESASALKSLQLSRSASTQNNKTAIFFG